VELDDAQLFGQSRTLRIKQLLGLDGSTGSLRSRRSRRYSDALIFMAFRGLKAQSDPVAEIVQRGEPKDNRRQFEWASGHEPPELQTMAFARPANPTF
jgi:hypothetical protein